MSTSPDNLQAGQDFFLKVVTQEQLDRVANLEDLERERWWTGFIISAVATCKLMVGGEMATLIARAAIDLENEDADQPTGE